LGFTPTEMFLTRGVGYHKEKLASLEEALSNAGIARFNLAKVSSIFPPHCKIISRKKGLDKLQTGQIVYCVLSVNQTSENRRLITSSIGVAIPADRNAYGYLSATMLGTILGVQIDPDLAWDEKRELCSAPRSVVSEYTSARLIYRTIGLIARSRGWFD